MTARTIGWALLVSGLLAIAAAYLLMGAAVAGLLPPVLMIYGVGTTLGGTLLCASPGRPAPAPLWLAVATVLAVVIVGFLVVLWRPNDVVSSPIIMGLPRGAAIVLLGVGVLPALVLPWAYARAASREKLDPDSIAAFVRECRAARAAERDE
ncbi:MAG TPA: hypothetical protein VFN22_05340 [Gemmatimonadales bacterium]|nr:hypothetical protein [Gemmatimonadales bacterium]